MNEPASYLSPKFEKAGTTCPPRLLHSDDWRAFSAWYIEAAERVGSTSRERSPDEWRAELRKQETKYFAAFSDGIIIGLAQIFPAFAKKDTWESVLEVSPAYQGNGVGTNLYRVMAQYLQRNYPGDHMVAHILDNNPSSIQAAVKAGLTFEGVLTSHESPAYLIYKIRLSEAAVAMRTLSVVR